MLLALACTADCTIEFINCAVSSIWLDDCSVGGGWDGVTQVLVAGCWAAIIKNSFTQIYLRAAGCLLTIVGWRQN